MSQLTPHPDTVCNLRAQLNRQSDALRGKLQFMDYLIRAAVADLERFDAESDPGTRLFLRQLIEMHSSNLAIESDNMRLTDELCSVIGSVLEGADEPSESERFLAGDVA